MSRALCGKPTPTGPCRRPVTTPGSPCGATHRSPHPPLPPVPHAAAAPDPLGADPLDGDGPVDPPAGSFPAPAVEALAAAAHLISSGQLPGCENEWDGIWDDLAPLGDPIIVDAAQAAEDAADQHQRFTDSDDPRYDGTVDDIWVTTATVDVAGLTHRINRYTRLLDADDALIAARGRRPEGRCWAARVVEPPELEHLAYDPVGQVRYIVAERTTDPAVLTRLASDDDRWVAEEALFNRACPDAAITAASQHPNPWHADTAAASEPTTPPNRLTELAANPRHLIRRRVAERADLPPGVLARLANDDDGFVAAAARANPAFTATEAAHAGLLTD